DQKYGLGERMVTLSGAQTLADLKMTASNQQMTGSGAQQTQQTQQTFAGGAPVSGTLPSGTMPGGTFPGGTMPGGPTGTRAGSDEATVMERNLTTPRPGSDEATVMERLGGGAAAPTAIEAKMKFGDAAAANAEATVLERQIDAGALRPKKKNGAMIAIAAGVIAVVAGLGVFLTRKPETAPVATTTVIPSGTAVTTTAAVPMAPNEGVLLLSASPWGDIDRIVSTKDNKTMSIDDNLSTPARIELPPGEYSITLRDASGRPKTERVTVESGKPTRHKVDMGDVNYDELYREVTRQ
ncbi:MAG TPA: hypothetical protein VF215_13655, partial [Thermoanaerobaculia bacterium]